jgi:hypothetical protein
MPEKKEKVFGRFHNRESQELFNLMLGICMQHGSFQEGELAVSIRTRKPRGMSRDLSERLGCNPMLDVRNLQSGRSSRFAVTYGGGLIVRDKNVEAGSTAHELTAIPGENRLTRNGALAIIIALDKLRKARRVPGKSKRSPKVFGRFNNRESRDLFFEMLNVCLRNDGFREGNLDISVQTRQPERTTPNFATYIANNPMLRVKNRSTGKSMFFAVGNDGELVARSMIVDSGATKIHPAAILGENRLTDIGVEAVQDAIDEISS